MGGLWLPLEESSNLVIRCRRKIQTENLLPHLRWRRDALQPPEVQRDQLNRNTCVHIPDDGLRCVTLNTRGFIGSLASPQLSGENTSCSRDLPRIMM